MYPFAIVCPSSVAEAVAALARSGGRALAGGQSLVGAMKLRLAQPGTLVDLSRVPGLAGIRRDGDGIVVGAMTRHADIATSTEVRAAIPALAALAGGIGDRQVRNMGTLGGSLANNDPAACWPAAVLGVDATVVTSTRRIAAADFFKGMYETALAADELIVAVEFPVPRKAAYAKFANPASRFALVGVFVAQTGGGVRVAVTGAASSVFRATSIEDALSVQWTANAASGAKVDPAGLNGDLHASPEYRAHLISVLAARAVAAAG